MTPDQCRAARILLGRTQAGLTKHAGMSRPSVIRFEWGDRVADRTGENLYRSLEEAGIRYEDDWGVCYGGKRKVRKRATSKKVPAGHAVGPR